MLRRMLIDAIRSDPDWKDGYYTTQPRALRSANVFFGIATSGGAQGLYQLAPNRAQADRLVAERLAAPFTADANDFLYQWDASRDYNPAPMLGRITAALLAINSADDERTSSRVRNHGAGDQAHQKCALLSDPCRAGYAGARHHRDGEILERTTRGVPGECPGDGERLGVGQR
jgi:hypothetical protein